MKKVMIEKNKISEDKINELKSAYEVIRENNNNIVVLVENGKDISEFNGLIEMNEA